MIGMREERYLTWLPCKVPGAYRNRFKKSGKSELFEWPRGPTRTTDNTGIPKRNQSEALVFKATSHTMTKPLEKQSMRTCLRSLGRNDANVPSALEYIFTLQEVTEKNILAKTLSAPTFM